MKSEIYLFLVWLWTERYIDKALFDALCKLEQEWRKENERKRDF